MKVKVVPVEKTIATEMILEHLEAHTDPENHNQFIAQNLEQLHQNLLQAPSQINVDVLCSYLLDLKNNLSSDEWDKFSRFDCLTHAIKTLLHTDPFTYRAYEKPRGYAGDACMMDYIYFPQRFEAGLSASAKRIFGYTANIPAAKAVRSRRVLAAKEIDTFSKNKTNVTVLSLACGHLREYELIQSVKNHQIAKYYALDSDVSSLEEVKKSYSQDDIVDAQRVSVRNILSGAKTFSNIDFVYTLGLYDYLPQMAAQKLTKALFDMLAPAGKLMISNYVPSIRDRGYMESFMDWRLIYRDEKEMDDLCSLIDLNTVHHRKMFYEENQNILFLELVKQ